MENWKIFPFLCDFSNGLHSPSILYSNRAFLVNKYMLMTIKELKKCLNESLVLEFIKHIPGHKNSKGEDAPWVIMSHETKKVISSHKTKEDAKKHLQHMHIFKW